jgi:putative Ca2+/H+ antiporter (TMEM165/GDT1 family)
MLYAFAVAIVLITLAELGDKTQILALCLAARYRWWQVLIGILAATLFIHFFSTVVGQAVGSLLPQLWLGIVTGALFVGFGVWTLRGDRGDDDDGSRVGRFGPIATVAIAFFLAELGDKTQIMTMTIAADPAAVLRTFGAAGPAITGTLARIGLSAEGLTSTQSFWGVWMGSTVGMMIADGVAIVAGSVLGKRLPGRLITRVSGGVFIVFGVATAVAAIAKAL